jgi:N-acylneuraminate cytidylyltransferase
MYQGATNNKLEIAQDICQTESISLDEVAFIGDDINDLELLKQVGLAACPSDAVKAVKNTINIAILNSKGGEGVVREFVEKYITK